MKNNTIILTEQQRKLLTNLWFVYGNNGKNHTHHNHRYIQNIIEHGEDSEEFYKNSDSERSIKAGVNWNTIKLTEECVNEVKTILKYK